MLHHERQWLLRSTFIRGSFIPLTALAMMVMEITEFHPYHISDVSHFYALYFCLVFITRTLPLDSSPREYQINSFRDSFRKGFPPPPRWQSLQHGGKKHPNNKTQPRSSCYPKPPDNSSREPWNTKAKAWRLFWFTAGFTGWTMPKPAAPSKPELCYSLGINPQQQFAASFLLFMLKSVSRKVSGLFRHPSPGKYLPSRGTRNTDVAFVNSALKNSSSNSSFSSMMLYFSSPDSLWWCCSLFLYGGHPAAWQLQSFPHVTHAVTLP